MVAPLPCSPGHSHLAWHEIVCSSRWPHLAFAVAPTGWELLPWSERINVSKSYLGY